jgi:phosphoribosyl-AMP cyclohydrolase / phosphoribosyl-ATP pyrophosphohydrolase
LTLKLPEGLRFDAAGLIPVVIQERGTGDILMLGYANALALLRTVETGLAHFWSRSRKTLWQKGETSGNVLRVRELRVDCDRDTLLALVDPLGPTCHTNQRTCFGEGSPTSAGQLGELERVIASRAESGPDGSYTAGLLGQGREACLAKLSEEAAELVEAARSESDVRLAEETADLLFHLLLVLRQRGVSLEAALEVLRARRAVR